eukprot:gene14971-13469_t
MAGVAATPNRDWTVVASGNHYPAWTRKDVAALSIAALRDRVVLGVARPFLSKGGAWRRYYAGCRATGLSLRATSARAGEVAAFVFDGLSELRRSVFAVPRPGGVPLDLVLDVDGAHGTSVGEARREGERVLARLAHACSYGVWLGAVTGDSQAWQWAMGLRMCRKRMQHSPLRGLDDVTPALMADLRTGLETRGHAVEHLLILDATRLVERVNDGQRCPSGKYSYHLHVIFRDICFAQIADLRAFLTDIIPDHLASGVVDSAAYYRWQEMRLAYCVSGPDVLASVLRPLAWERATPVLAVEAARSEQRLAAPPTPRPHVPRWGGTVTRDYADRAAILARCLIERAPALPTAFWSAPPPPAVAPARGAAAGSEAAAAARPACVRGGGGARCVPAPSGAWVRIVGSAPVSQLGEVGVVLVVDRDR